MRFLKVILLGALLVNVTACGNNEVSTKVDVPPATELLKSALQITASKGERVSSAASQLQQYVERMGKEDAAKAKVVSPMIDSLIALKDPAKIKAKANEILKAL